MEKNKIGQTTGIIYTRLKMRSQSFDSPAEGQGLPFDKLKALSPAEGLSVDPERRFYAPTSKAGLGAAEWSILIAVHQELLIRPPGGGREQRGGSGGKRVMP